MSEEKLKEQFLNSAEPEKSEEVLEMQPTEAKEEQPEEAKERKPLPGMKAKEKEKVEEDVEDKPSMYKGYEIKWLKKIGEEHPDFYLVAEYEEKYGEI